MISICDKVLATVVGEVGERASGKGEEKGEGGWRKDEIEGR